MSAPVPSAGSRESATGEPGNEAPQGRIAGAWAVDFLLVAAAGLVAAVLAAKAFPDSLGAVVGTAVACWFAAGFVYGFLCFTGRGLGNLLCGTRIIRADTGGIPGFWRRGWLMFLRTAGGPFVLMVLFLGAALGNTSTRERAGKTPRRSRFVSVRA